MLIVSRGVIFGGAYFRNFKVLPEPYLKKLKLSLWLPNQLYRLLVCVAGGILLSVVPLIPPATQV